MAKKKKRKAIGCIHCRRMTIAKGLAIRQTCDHCGKSTTRRRAKQGETTEMLDRLFSLVVRRSAANEFGQVRCVTCCKVMAWQECHAGHFISRKKFATRWGTDNCHPQCPSCNSPTIGNGRQLKHARWIDVHVHAGRADEIEEMSEGPRPTRAQRGAIARNLYFDCVTLGIIEAAEQVKDRYPAPWIELGVSGD